ncbi:hypothetical protein N7532_003189 [Penicillium argentinense]|uniref:G domain-containing protein n=1 Tax=Penicillium argentinense TaxID=1131581 RepID=A0A9W9KDN7_9EURO|nr:uncharacterized protein N7532_003189 [Penicillium argentinense]KAJ5102660.1 hypothetical protein N7532_003189 [Penicillium argentinense]
MDILSSTAQQLTDQAQRLSAITGLVKSSPRDRIFLVMGKTGSGKSSFVARCTDKDVTVGHGLYSCTSDIDAYSYIIPGQNRCIHLIDTPGFNDTNRSDIETLSVLASYLGASYANGVSIHGIIVLHPITDNRMSGTSMRNVEMIKKMCGWTSYENLVVATTMWPPRYSFSNSGSGSYLDTESQDQDRAALEKRETELFTEERFLGELVARGARVFRHNKNGRRDANEEMFSARQIVSHLITESDTSMPPALRLQREIIEERKTLGETSAGMAIAGDLYKARKEHEKQLRDLEEDLKGQLAQADASHVAELEDLKADIQKKLKKAEEEKESLRKSMTELHEEEERAWEEKIQTLDKQFREQIAQKEEELEELEDSIREIREETMSMSSRWSFEADKEYEGHENIVKAAREEVVQAKDAHEKLKAQTGNITNGLANGMAAGVTTAIVTGGMLLDLRYSISNRLIVAMDSHVWGSSMCGHVE